MVRTLSVTSSPVRPSPRVAARTSRPVPVDQVQRDAVDLELAQSIATVVPTSACDARGPRVELLGAEHVVQAQHPLQVLGGGEIGGEARATDQLGRRIRCAQLGMLLLERRKPAQQLVELRVGDGRRVPHVVAELVFAHLVGQFTPLPPSLGPDGVSFWRTHLGRLSKSADTDREALSPLVPRKPATGPPPRPTGETAGSGSRWPASEVRSAPSTRVHGPDGCS